MCAAFKRNMAPVPLLLSVKKERLIIQELVHAKIQVASHCTTIQVASHFTTVQIEARCTTELRLRHNVHVLFECAFFLLCVCNDVQGRSFDRVLSVIDFPAVSVYLH
jgi:hypothetical protein